MNNAKWFRFVLLWFIGLSIVQFVSFYAKITTNDAHTIEWKMIREQQAEIINIRAEWKKQSEEKQSELDVLENDINKAFIKYPRLKKYFKWTKIKLDWTKLKY